MAFESTGNMSTHLLFNSHLSSGIKCAFVIHSAFYNSYIFITKTKQCIYIYIYIYIYINMYIYIYFFFSPTAFSP